MKKCIKCDIEKQDSEFRNSRKSCKECERKIGIISAKKWYYKNQENKNKAILRAKIWNSKNKKVKNLLSIAWNKNHPEKVRINTLKYRQKNPEKVKNQHSKWVKNHPNYYIRNSHIRRARKRGNTLKSITIKEQNEIFEKAKLNGKCPYCSKDMNIKNPKKNERWSLDHKIPLSRGGGHTKENILYCCLGCNMKKHTKTFEEFNIFLKNAGK